MSIADEQAILGIPPIVVVEPIDVGPPLSIVAIDVEHRDALYRAPSVSPPLEFSQG